MNDAFLDAWKQAEKDGNTIAAADAWFTNQNHDGDERVTFRAKAAFALGKVEHATLYPGAVERKKDWQRVLRQAFREVDVIATPVLRNEPFKIPFFEEPAVFEARVLGIQNTVAVNYAGNPALAVPIPLVSEDPPVPLTSVQIIGPPESEAQLLNIGRMIESK